MKKKITIITISLIMFLILGVYFSSISNAAIEIKSGATRHFLQGYNGLSTAYQYCYDMRSSTSTLGNNSLDPHLSLSADWGAVAYLSASAYGNTRGAQGYQLESSVLSTTNNKTGVINFGGATLNYGDKTFVPTYFPNTYNGNGQKFLKLYENRLSKYVEVLEEKDGQINTEGMAMDETKGWYGAAWGTYEFDYQMHYRTRGTFGFEVTTPSNDTNCCYRPVIWN